MNKRIVYESKRFHKVLDILTEFDTDWQGFPAFVDVEDDYEKDLVKFDKVTAEVIILKGGVVLDKNEFKLIYADNILHICKKTKVYAKKINDNDLKKKLSYTQSDLYATYDNMLAEIGKDVYDIVKPLVDNNLLVNYKVTSQMMTDLNQNTIDYKDYLTKVNQTKIDDQGNVGYRDKLLDKMLSHLEDLTDLMVDFESTNPDFYNAFMAARKFEKPIYGIRSIKGHVYNKATKKALPNVNLTLVLTDEERKRRNAESGYYSFKNVDEGEYTLLVTCVGFKPQEIPVVVYLNKSTTLDIYLEKA